MHEVVESGRHDGGRIGLPPEIPEERLAQLRLMNDRRSLEVEIPAGKGLGTASPTL